MEGFLEKKGVSGWTKRWFVLDGKRVMYYNQKGDRHPRGTLELNAGSQLKKIATKEHGFHLVSNKQALTVNTLSGDDRESWMRAIADKVQQFKDALVASPKRKGTRMISAGDTFFEVDNYYTYKKPVGHGAYGEVISALDTRDNSKVAIKKIPSAFDDVVDAKRIVREVRLLRRLDHMNIIKIVDVLPPPSLADFNDVYIVSELMDTDLHRVIYSSQRLSDQHVKYFLYQILCGVKYMHSASVLHRDLKPSNILLSTNCDLKLCDFGLSRGVSSPDEEEAAELTEYVVPRWYRSPEIMLAAEYGYPIDIWSVGCIFAEMLRREPLFRGETYLQMLKLIAKFVGKPRDESELAFVTNPKAQKFMEDLPEYPPADLRRRFPSAGADAVDLLARILVMRPDRRLSVDEALRHPYLRSVRDKKAETTALEPVDFADVELAPLNKNNLRRLMHEVVLAYHPELRSPDGGSSIPKSASRIGGREAARDGGSRGSSSSVAQGESSHVSSRMASGGLSSSVNTHARGVGVGGGQRERSSRSDRDRDGRSSGGMSGASARSSSSSSDTRSDARSHAAARVRSGGGTARHPFPTEGMAIKDEVVKLGTSLVNAPRSGVFTKPAGGRSLSANLVERSDLAQAPVDIIYSEKAIAPLTIAGTGVGLKAVLAANSMRELSEQGNRTEAEPLDQRSQDVPVRTKVIDPEHSDATKSPTNQAALVEEQVRSEEAAHLTKDTPAGLSAIADSSKDASPFEGGDDSLVMTTLLRQLWLPSCGDINSGAMTSPPADGAPLSLHSVSRRALYSAEDDSTRILHLPPGGISGCGVVCQRWRDTYGQVEIKAAPHDRKHIEGVRLLDDVFMVQVSRRQESGACLTMPVVEGPAGVTFPPGTASISYYVGRHDPSVLMKGEKGGKEGTESYVRDNYFPVTKANGADQPWEADSDSAVVWKGDEIWLEVELQHFSLKGLAVKKWHGFTGARGSRTPLGSNGYPEIQVFNDTEECLRVMLVPETFLTAEAHSRSQAAGLSLQIAGHGLAGDRSGEMSDSLSQQPTFVYSSLTWITIPKGETIDLELPGGKRCRILWCSISDRFKPEDLPIDQDTKNPVNEDELESHGYETLVTGRWPYKTYHFKEKALPGELHRSLLFVRVWEQSSISFSDQRKNKPRTMRRSVLAEYCVWNTSVPSLDHINRKIISWLVTVVPGAGAPFR